MPRGEAFSAERHLPASSLPDLLEYDLERGFLTWKHRPRSMFKNRQSFLAWNTRYAGKIASSLSKSGYYRTTIFDRRYRSHRVCWALVHGEWPVAIIDHVNGDPADNRLANLRLATNSENTANQKLRSNNLCGLKGVSFDPRRGVWRARVQQDRKQIWLGQYPTAEEAHSAYANAAKALHGEFARLQ